MCGIFGTIRRSDFIKLYELNKDRGVKSTGFCFNKPFTLVKRSGEVQGDYIPERYSLYLGHTRAPTNAVTAFAYDQAHPFTSGDWVVGHNGIIHNFDKLKERYDIKSDVDSSCIPTLIDKHQGVYKLATGEINSILAAIAELDGIYACWVFNRASKNLYLFRCASSIFVHKHRFSSVDFEGATALEEGILYQLDHHHFSEVATFPYNSPYYIPED